MMGLFKDAHEWVWAKPRPARPGWEAALAHAARMLLVLVRDVRGGQLTLRAMSLVYTTLLSIVPLLALSFSVLKAFGVYNQIQPLLMKFLEPLGPQGDEVSRRIIEFIENMNVGVLGSVGLALLVYTAVSLVQKIEESFNYIWRISQARQFGERFSRYLSMLIVGPILFFSAMGLTATVMRLRVVRSVVAVGPVSAAVHAFGTLLPYLLVIAAFTFAYTFIPNTKVRLGPALVGGVVGGVLWQTAGWAFAEFAAGSTKYEAIYSSFAILILFMIWVYLSWLILLFGSDVAFYAQHPEYLVARGGDVTLSNRMRERLALGAMSHIAGRFTAALPPLSLRELGQLLRVPTNTLQPVLEVMEKRGLLSASNADPPRYLPARDLAVISVSEVLEAVRTAGDEYYGEAGVLPVPPQADDMLTDAEHAMVASLEKKSVRDLAAREKADDRSA